MKAYYNDHDKHKCAWMRELIKAGAITDGRIDRRDLRHVRPNDVSGYERVHLCAGIAAWDYALDLAGWSGHVWTASFPCPSFSAAGKGKGFGDTRHLWPVGFELIRQCRPPVLFMEQVSSAIGYGWLDLVAAQLEGENYALGAAVLASASVGAPCLRERLYVLAVAAEARHERPEGQQRSGEALLRARPGQRGGTGKLDRADAPGLFLVKEARLHDQGTSGDDLDGRRESGRVDRALRAGLEGFGGDVGDDDQSRWDDESTARSLAEASHASDALEARGQLGFFAADARAMPTQGRWADADWIFCTDGRWRAVSAGTFPLAARTPSRLVRLRGYGDALNVEVAAAFIAAAKEAIDCMRKEQNHAAD